jgi:hypothetical protein
MRAFVIACWVVVPAITLLFILAIVWGLIGG